MWTKRPERSFGSNQVLLGGMIWPASAMSMSCSTVVGIHGEGDGCFAGIDELHEFAGAADAADEVNALAGARIVDAEDGGEQAVLERSTSSREIGSASAAGSQARPCQAPSKYMRMSPGLRGDGRAVRCDGELLFHRGEETARA